MLGDITVKKNSNEQPAQLSGPSDGMNQRPGEEASDYPLVITHAPINFNFSPGEPIDPTVITARDNDEDFLTALNELSGLIWKGDSNIAKALDNVIAVMYRDDFDMRMSLANCDPNAYEHLGDFSKENCTPFSLIIESFPDTPLGTKATIRLLQEASNQGADFTTPIYHDSSGFLREVCENSEVLAWLRKHRLLAQREDEHTLINSDPHIDLLHEQLDRLSSLFNERPKSFRSFAFETFKVFAQRALSLFGRDTSELAHVSYYSRRQELLDGIQDSFFFALAHEELEKYNALSQEDRYSEDTKDAVALLLDYHHILPQNFVVDRLIDARNAHYEFNKYGTEYGANNLLFNICNNPYEPPNVHILAQLITNRIDPHKPVKRLDTQTRLTLDEEFTDRMPSSIDIVEHFLKDAEELKIQSKRSRWQEVASMLKGWA